MTQINRKINTNGSKLKTTVNQKEDILIFENQAWMTSEEAAKYLRRSVGQVRNMVWRGQLRARKYCRRLYFRRLELDKAIESSYTGGF